MNNTEKSTITINQYIALMLDQVRTEEGLPPELRACLPLELNDGKGSYICEYGYVHDYSNFDFDAVEREINDPNTKTYSCYKEMIADIMAEDDDDDDDDDE